MVTLLLLFRASPSHARPGGGQAFGGSKSGQTLGGSNGSGAKASPAQRSTPTGPSMFSPSHTDPAPHVDHEAPPVYVFENGPPEAAAAPPRASDGRTSSVPDAKVFAGLMLCAGLVIVARSLRKNASHAAPVDAFPAERSVATRLSARARLGELAAHDPTFSVIVFEDFASALYVEVVLAAGKSSLDGLSPYLSPVAIATVRSRRLEGTTHVLVGALRIEAVEGLEPGHDAVTAHLIFETNLANRDPSTGVERATYSKERWSLRRPKGVRGRAPDKARLFGCPSCSAPLDAVLAGRCAYCSKEVATGAFDWQVIGITVLSAEERGPLLTGDTAEAGNECPTLVADDAKARLEELSRRDAAFSYAGFTERVSAVFHMFHAAWSARDIVSMRPFLSDAFYATQSYWVAEYLRQRLRNITQNAGIRRVELARVTSDAYFEAITVRVFASCLDYTVSDTSGALVSGSDSEPRSYTEYWTFMRGRAASGTQQDRQCPRCGASLPINMAGDCGHCGSKVLAGGFDWVLARIEQDEVYDG